MHSAGDFEVVDEAGDVVKASQAQANGKYTLQLTQAAQDRLSTENPNYAITFGTNALTVSQRSITVQINDVDTTYDDPSLPQLTATINVPNNTIAQIALVHW